MRVDASTERKLSEPLSGSLPCTVAPVLHTLVTSWAAVVRRPHCCNCHGTAPSCPPQRTKCTTGATAAARTRRTSRSTSRSSSSSTSSDRGSVSLRAQCHWYHGHVIEDVASPDDVQSSQ